MSDIESLESVSQDTLKGAVPEIAQSTELFFLRIADVRSEVEGLIQRGDINENQEVFINSMSIALERSLARVRTSDWSTAFFPVLNQASKKLDAAIPHLKSEPPALAEALLQVQSASHVVAGGFPYSLVEAPPGFDEQGLSMAGFIVDSQSHAVQVYRENLEKVVVLNEKMETLRTWFEGKQAELQKVTEELTGVVTETSVAGLAKHYRDATKQLSSSESRWTYLSLGIWILAAGAVASIAFISNEAGITWSRAIVSAAVTSILVFAATFAAESARSARQQAGWYRRRSAKVASILGYSSSLEQGEKLTLIKAFGERMYSADDDREAAIEMRVSESKFEMPWNKRMGGGDGD